MQEWISVFFMPLHVCCQTEVHEWMAVIPIGKRDVLEPMPVDLVVLFVVNGALKDQASFFAPFTSRFLVKKIPP